MTTAITLFTGIPRSGTSLCCRLLGDSKNLVALSEPLRLDEFDALEETELALQFLGSRIAEISRNIVQKGRAPSTHVAGQLNDARVVTRRDGTGLRAPQGEQGEIAIDKPLSAGFQLVIKHNALFAALLPGLVTRWQCLALVRNPLAVLASWQTVDLPVNRGRLPAGEKYSKELAHQLVNQPDRLRRQLIILDWFFRQYQDHLSTENILRYEDVIASNGAKLFQAAGILDSPSGSLSSQNQSQLYAGVDLQSLYRSLREYSGCWESIYQQADFEEILSGQI